MPNEALTILAVDDNRDNLVTFRAVAQDALPGCRVLTAQSGEAGLVLAAAEDPDVILLDIVMPGMDGFDVCRRLKADVRLRIIPVIFLTALRTDQAARIRALETGAEAFLSKPIDPLELIAQIRAMAKIKASHQARRLATDELEALVAERTRELERELMSRRQAEEAAARLYQANELLLTSVAEGILGLDVRGRHTFVNPAAAAMLGYAPEELIGRPSHSVWHHTRADGTPNPVEECAILAVYRSGTAHRSADDLFWRKDGSSFPVQYTGTPMRDGGRVVGAVVTFTDITELRASEEARRKLGEQLVQSQKMESVGRLAGGVAHDFNNMLGVIIGHAELALMHVGANTPLLEDLQEIRKAAERSAELTRQLLAFARKQTVVRRVLDLNETVDGMLRMLRRLIGEQIELVWRPGAGAAVVRMDPSQIDQILANLLVNGRDAIEGAGTITIETSSASLDAAHCATRPHLAPGEYVLLSVRDSGRGMDPGTMSNIFEPFFTTKDVGQGTGLGLATVYGIVKQNEGLIGVQSEKGVGTRFDIYLPRQAGCVTRGAMNPAQPPLARPHETILLVEDERAILEMTTLMLRGLGYHVLPASTADEAMELAVRSASELSLLVTDVVMPATNGRELATNLLSLYPGLKLLYMSGYTSNILAHHGVAEEGGRFLQKPFSLNELALKVREALE